MLQRVFAVVELALIVGCRPPSSAPASNAPSSSAACSNASSTEALTFSALRIDSNQKPFAHAILFASGSSDPLASSMGALDQIAGSMKAIPNVSLLAVMGHGDKTESPEIGDQRAARVIDLLIARGVERARLEARPFAPPPAVEEARCGNTTPAEIETERKRALAAERAVRFAIARIDEK